MSRWPESRSVARECAECHAPFITRQGAIARGRGKYCSRKCQDAGRRVPLEKRFWAKVEKRGPDECWPWTGRCHERGYGKIDIGGRGVVATRVMLELNGTPVPDDAEVCHACDNPNCVNPAHLWVGSHADNMADAARKGRTGMPPREICKRGHRFTEDNVYVRRNGHRWCRECARIRERARYSANRRSQAS